MIFNYRKEIKKVKDSSRTQKPKIYLFGAPLHTNMGDNAQTICAQRWIEKYYKGYDLYIFDTVSCIRFNNYIIKKIAKKINDNDIIFLHSGYHTTDLYMDEENMQRAVIELFPNNKIILLPQTILYKNEEEKKKSMAIYNNHKDIHMLCRDEISYETAKQIFNNCKLLKFPDIVTTLIGTKKFNYKREGILMCLRNDKESKYGKENLKNIIEKLNVYGEIKFTDTTIDKDLSEVQKNKEKIINEIIEDYSKYKVIITDRYHGTIFSLIANTPVLVLSSTDHKLESGVKWFPKEFSNYVKYVKKIEDIPKQVERVFNTKYEYELSPYFNVEYYDKLKELIEKGD